MDFSQVRSLDQAWQLSADGQLVGVLLFPTELGGDSRPENVVFVPAEAAAAKDEITGILLRMFQDDLINQLSVTPEYKGQSFVPAKINVRAWHSQKPGGFEPSLTIW
jgi:hypothetical protein